MGVEETVSIHKESDNLKEGKSLEECELQEESTESTTCKENNIPIQNETKNALERCSSEISSMGSEWEGSDSEDEICSESSDKKEVETKPDSEDDKVLNKSEPKKEVPTPAPAVMTPMTRRRMEMAGASATIQLPKSGPPPPPPASPPAADVSSKVQNMLENTTTRFESLQKEVYDKRENEMIIKENKIVIKKEENSEEEESEWEEWTEEETDCEYEEEEEESEAVKAKDEKWQNILTDSGPTTFTAEFSVKLS